MKSCILARVAASPEVIFEQRKYSEECWSHDLEKLLKLTGLDADFATEAAANATFDASWIVVKKWREQSRYLMKTEADAKSLYGAITDPADGVMRWIKARW